MPGLEGQLCTMSARGTYREAFAITLAVIRQVCSRAIDPRRGIFLGEESPNRQRYQRPDERAEGEAQGPSKWSGGLGPERLGRWTRPWISDMKLVTLKCHWASSDFFEMENKKQEESRICMEFRINEGRVDGKTSISTSISTSRFMPQWIPNGSKT